MSRFCVLLVVFDQFVVGIGADSEPANRTSDLFRHSYSVANVLDVDLTFVISASHIGIRENGAFGV